VSVAEAGVLLLDEGNLLGRKFELLLGGSLFELKPPLVAAPDPRLVEMFWTVGTLTQTPSSFSWSLIRLQPHAG